MRTRQVLRRGLRESPELRRGIGFTLILALVVTIANLVSPILDPADLRPRVRGRVPAGVRLRDLRPGGDRRDRLLSRRPGERRLATSSEQALANLRGADVRAHPRAVDRRADEGEARGVFVARVTADVDSLTAVHRVGRDRLDPVRRADRRDPRPHARLLVAAHDPHRRPRDPAAADRGQAAGRVLERVQPGAHARRRDADRGQRVRDGRGRRARLRARRGDRPPREAGDRGALPRADAGAPACVDALPDGRDLHGASPWPPWWSSAPCSARDGA